MRGDFLNLNLDKKRPLCPQICEQICFWIVKGNFPTEEKLPSVREIAVLAGVNPNTVQHSFELLEQQGILYSVRGSGWYVSSDISNAQEKIFNILKEKTELYFADMEKLGMTAEQTKKFIEEWIVNE